MLWDDYGRALKLYIFQTDKMTISELITWLEEMRAKRLTEEEIELLFDEITEMTIKTTTI